MACIFESSRTFQVWRSTVSHNQLLLRSTKSESDLTRLDVLFKPVSALKLRTHLNGLSVREAASPEAARVLAEASEVERSDQHVYIVESHDFNGWVIAAGVWTNEDQGEYSDPSALWPE
jgi:hypothetical protein